MKVIVSRGRKTMKKMMTIVIGLMIMSSIIPLAYADGSVNSTNNVEIDAVTQQQVEIMKNRLGAEIRLLQLEKSITKNINIGEDIIAFLKDSDVNTTDLEVILAEFEILQEEVQSADVNDSEAVALFVDLKHDATNLSKDFRVTLRELINSSAHEKITEQIQNMTFNHSQNLSETIKQKIRLYNKNQFQHIYQLIGKNQTRYLNQYQNGSVTQDQVKQNITLLLNQSRKHEQFMFLKNLKQENIKNKIQIQRRVQNASAGFQSRQEDRMKKRLQRLENNSDNPLQQQLMKRIQNKIHEIEDTESEDNQNGPGGPNGMGGNADNSETPGSGPDDADGEETQNNNTGSAKSGEGGMS